MGLGYEPQVMGFLFKFCGADVAFALGILGFNFLNWISVGFYFNLVLLCFSLL
jgi:hypothetical protein